MPAMDVHWESLSSSSLTFKLSLQITSTDGKSACISTALAYVTFPNYNPWPNAYLDIWEGRADTITLKELDFRAYLLLFVKQSYINFKADPPVTINHFQWKSPKDMLSSSAWLPEPELNCWDHYMLLLLMEGRNMHIITWRTKSTKVIG